AALWLAEFGDVAGNLAAAGRMADMDRVPEVEMLDHGRGIGGVVVHVVARIDLRRTAVAAPVVCDDPISLRQEEKNLVVPVLCRKRPAVMEMDGLGVLRAPILVKNLRAVAGLDVA